MIVSDGWEYKDSRGGRYWKRTKGDGIVEESEIRGDSREGGGAREMNRGEHEEAERGREGWGLWLSLLTTIDFL